MSLVLEQQNRSRVEFGRRRAPKVLTNSSSPCCQQQDQDGQGKQHSLLQQLCLNFAVFTRDLHVDGFG